MFSWIQIHVYLQWVFALFRMFLSWDEDPILGSYMVLKIAIAHAWHVPYLWVGYVKGIDLFDKKLRKNDISAIMIQKWHMLFTTKAGDIAKSSKNRFLLRKCMWYVYAKHMSSIYHVYLCHIYSAATLMFQTWTVFGSFLFLQLKALQ